MSATAAASAPRGALPHSGAATVARSVAGICGVTIAAAIVSLLVPGLGLGGTPTAVMRGTPAEAASIAANNGRLFFVPFMFLALRLTSDPVSRTFGDIVVGALALGNTVLAGLTIGRHGSAIVPYLWHMPLEWLALAVALAAWLAHRGCVATWRSAAPYGVAVVLLTIAGALVESYANPQA